MNHLKKLVQVSTVVLLIGAAVIAAAPEQALAGAVGASVKQYSVTIDGNGRQPSVNGDKVWKVFEIIQSETASLIKDEAGKAPVVGVIHQVCAETGTVGSAQDQWVFLWDRASTTTPALVPNTTRTLMAPLPRATTTVACSGILDAVFTEGAVVGQSATGRRAWVYWAPSGRQ